MDYSKPDIEIAKKHLSSYTNMGSVYTEVSRLYQRFTDQLLDAGIEEKQLKGLDLQELMDLAEDRGIRLKAVYNNRISVTDDLSDIRLHIRSIQPDKSVLSKFADVSFVQNASNYIQKVLKQIIIIFK